ARMRRLRSAGPVADQPEGPGGAACQKRALVESATRGFVAQRYFTHETWVMRWSMDANEMAALVACFGESLAGNVARVASPTRNTLKSLERFWYPAVVRQKHMSVAYPTR